MKNSKQVTFELKNNVSGEITQETHSIKIGVNSVYWAINNMPKLMTKEQSIINYKIN
jgi:hypothetical protein